MSCLHVGSKVVSSTVGERAQFTVISYCFMFNVEMSLQIFPGEVALVAEVAKMVASPFVGVDMLVKVEFMMKPFGTPNVGAFQLRLFVNLSVPAEMNLCREELSANFCNQKI